jgi:hypothetical protein
MSALAMILSAAMSVPGDGPEKASGEIAKLQRLDLRGEWKVEFDRYCEVTGWSGKQWCRVLRIQDMGGGRLRMAVPKIGKDNDLVFIPCTGTYSQERDRVVIHFRIVEEKTPAVFRGNIPQGCIIFYRVDP